jgi:hypothetical protein
MRLAAGSLAWLTGIGVHSSYAAAVLGPLMTTIGLINAFNRMNVMTRQPARDYDVCAVVPLEVPDSGASIRSWRPGSLRADSTVVTSRSGRRTLCAGRAG